VRPKSRPAHRAFGAAILAVGLIALAVALGTAGHQAQSQPVAATVDGAEAPAAAGAAGSSAGEETGAMTTQPAPGKYRELTPEEERVIVHKGTEGPFTGKYTDFFGEGVYTCRRCGAMLYRSQDKFHSDCGWPAFDDELPGAVRRLPDADGVRTEIECTNCGAHLGHVFTGEGLTAKDTRHCVNSISLQFIPAAEVRYGRAIFAGGCFWGVEYWMQKQPGVLKTTVGYTGGTTDNPTYEQIHSRDTGHAEAVEVLFDPVRVSFEQLAKLFFEIHDPTQLNRQGPDVGTPYRSAVFTTDEEQRQVAEKLIAELKGRGLNVVTQVVPAGRFWPAEAYHQSYYADKGAEPPCHVRQKLW